MPSAARLTFTADEVSSQMVAAVSKPSMRTKRPAFTVIYFSGGRSHESTLVLVTVANHPMGYSAFCR